MASNVFVSLPVKSLDKSVEFFSKLGFAFDARLTDKTAACMKVAEDVFVMLVAEEEFKAITPSTIRGATTAFMPVS